MHPKQSNYNRSSQERKREAGLIKLERWIHKSRKAEFDALVKEMQKPSLSDDDMKELEKLDG